MAANHAFFGQNESSGREFRTCVGDFLHDLVAVSSHACGPFSPEAQKAS